jgi:hypothetical protein
MGIGRLPHVATSRFDACRTLRIKTRRKTPGFPFLASTTALVLAQSAAAYGTPTPSRKLFRMQTREFLRTHQRSEQKKAWIAK